MNIGRTIAALVVPLLCVGAGSQILACLDELHVQEPSADAGDDGALGCAHATPPLPPNVADDGSNDVTFVTAIRTVRFKYTAKGDPIGLDLDRYCTCQGESPSCIAPAGQAVELQCDLAQGRDNMAPAWIQLFEFIYGFDTEGDSLSELYSEFANLGRWSNLMRVSEYNGKPDDPAVRVDWFPSPGMSSSGMPSPPLWNGTDEWPISPDSITMDGTPRYFDTAAYVTNNELVFSLPEGILRMGNGLTNFAISITNATAVATIEKDATGLYRLRSGVIAGRIPTADLFKMVTEFRDHNGVPFCATGNPYYQTTRDVFCRGLDIQSGSPQPNKLCDAMSFAIGFDTDSIAKVGAAETPMTMQMYCPPGEDPYSSFLDAGCPQVE